MKIMIGAVLGVLTFLAAPVQAEPDKGGTAPRANPAKRVPTSARAPAQSPKAGLTTFQLVQPAQAPGKRADEASGCCPCPDQRPG